MEKYLEILTTALKNPQNILLLVIGIAYGLLLLVDLISNKKFPFLGSALLLIVVAFCGLYVLKRELIPDTILNFLTNRYESVKVGLISWTLYFFILTIGNYVRKVVLRNRKQKRFEKNLEALPVELLWIVNHRGRVIFETNAAQGLQLSDRKIKKIFLEETEIHKKNLFKNLNELTELENFTLKLPGKNGEVHSFDIKKKNLYKRKFYNGYLLYRQTESAPVIQEVVKSSIDQVGLINGFDEPIAYYNLATNQIILNQLMQTALSVDNETITVNDFKKYIVKEDISFFEQSPKEKNQRHIFRLRLNNQAVWFEGIKLVSNDEMIIRKTSSINYRNKLSVKNHNELILAIDNLQKQQRQFGLFTLSFVDIIDKTMNKADSYPNQIISQYFKSLLEGHLKDNVTVYKLGNIEFGLLVDNLTIFDSLTKEIVDGQNHFQQAVVTINNETFTINLALGVVASKNVENLPAEEVVTASYQALMEASDPNYPNNYSIYYPKTNIVREYRLEDFDIDLSESFLEKFKLD